MLCGSPSHVEWPRVEPGGARNQQPAPAASHVRERVFLIPGLGCELPPSPDTFPAEASDTVEETEAIPAVPTRIPNPQMP